MCLCCCWCIIVLDSFCLKKRIFSVSLSADLAMSINLLFSVHTKSTRYICYDSFYIYGLLLFCRNLCIVVIDNHSINASSSYTYFRLCWRWSAFTMVHELLKYFLCFFQIWYFQMKLRKHMMQTTLK